MTRKTICVPIRKPRMGWREDIKDLPPEQRQLIEGGELSQRFAKQPLSMTHPAFIGGFYGFLVAMSLLLPIGYSNGWNQDTLRDWAFLGVAVDADHCNCWALFALLCDNIAPATHLLATGMGLPYAFPWLVNHQHLLCHWNRIRNLRSLGKWARIPWLVLTLGTGSSLHSPLMGPSMENPLPT